MLDPNFPQMPDPMFPHISPGVCFPRYSLDYGAMVLTAGEKFAGGLHIQFVTRQGIKLDEVSLWVQGKPGWEQRNHLDPNHFDEGHPDCVRMPEIPGCFNPYPYKVFVWISPISPFCPFVTPHSPHSPHISPTSFTHKSQGEEGLLAMRTRLPEGAKPRRAIGLSQIGSSAALGAAAATMLLGGALFCMRRPSSLPREAARV